MAGKNPTKLEQLRSRHRLIRDRSYLKIKESRQFIETSSLSDSHDDSVSTTGESELSGLLSPGNLSVDSSESKLPQHRLFLLEEENERLRRQLAELTAGSESFRSQQKQQQEEVQRLKQEFTEVLDDLNSRLKRQLTDVTAERDKLQRDLETGGERAKESTEEQEGHHQNEIVKLKQKVGTLRKELHLAQYKLRQQRLHEWLDKWTQNSGRDAAAISELLNGLEIREPDSNRNLHEFKGWLSKWGSASSKQGKLKGEQDCLDILEVDTFKKETEQAISNLQLLRTKQEETVSEEMKKTLENQIGQELEQSGNLRHQVNGILKLQTDSQNVNFVSSKIDKNNVSIESNHDMATQAEKLRLLFLDIRKLAKQHTGRRNAAKASESSENLDEVPDTSAWFSSFFPPEKLGEAKLPSEGPPGPRLGGKEDRNRGLIDGIDENSDSSSSEGTDYYPASHMEGLTTIFEHESCTESEASSRASEDSGMEEDVIWDITVAKSMEELMNVEHTAKGSVYEALSSSSNHESMSDSSSLHSSSNNEASSGYIFSHVELDIQFLAANSKVGTPVHFVKSQYDEGRHNLDDTDNDYERKSNSDYNCSYEEKSDSDSSSSDLIEKKKKIDALTKMSQSPNAPMDDVSLNTRPTIRESSKNPLSQSKVELMKAISNEYDLSNQESSSRSISEASSLNESYDDLPKVQNISTNEENSDSAEVSISDYESDSDSSSSDPLGKNMKFDILTNNLTRGNATVEDTAGDASSNEPSENALSDSKTDLMKAMLTIYDSASEESPSASFIEASSVNESNGDLPNLQDFLKTNETSDSEESYHDEKSGGYEEKSDSDSDSSSDSDSTSDSSSDSSSSDSNSDSTSDSSSDSSSSDPLEKRRKFDALTNKSRRLNAAMEDTAGDASSNEPSENALSDSKTDLLKAILSEYSSSCEDTVVQ